MLSRSEEGKFQARDWEEGKELKVRWPELWMPFCQSRARPRLESCSPSLVSPEAAWQHWERC